MQACRRVSPRFLFRAREIICKCDIFLLELTDFGSEGFTANCYEILEIVSMVELTLLQRGLFSRRAAFDVLIIASVESQRAAYSHFRAVTVVYLARLVSRQAGRY